MVSHLFDLCCLSDGWHWVLLAPNGHPYRVSDTGHPTREQAYEEMCSKA